MKKNEIISNLETIQKEIDAQIQESDIYSVQNVLNKLSAMMGLSAEIIKHTKRMLYLKQADVFDKGLKKELTPAMMNKYLEGQMADELAIDKYADRINAAITHRCDSLRTIISLYKIERQIENYGKQLS